MSFMAKKISANRFVHISQTIIYCTEKKRKISSTIKIKNIVFPVSKYTIVINKKVFNILNEYVLRGYKMFDKNSI